MAIHPHSTGGSSSQGSSLTIPVKYQFSGADLTACVTARDTYFTAHPTEKIAGLNILLAPTGAATVLEQYIGTSWTDISATITGPQGSQGPAGSNGTTPVKGIDYFDGTNGTNGIDGKPINPLGDYDNAYAYSKLDAVRYNGSGYVCKTSSTGHLPTDTLYWNPLVSKGDTGADGTVIQLLGTYSASTTYQVGNVVKYNGASFICKLANTVGVTPVEGANWQNMCEKGDTGLSGLTARGNFNAATQYAINDVVTYTDSSVTKVYAATSIPPVGTLPTNTSYWQYLPIEGAKGDTGASGSSVVPKGTYSAATSYAALDLVTLNGSSYICLQSCAGKSPDTETSYWQLSASKGATGAKGDASSISEGGVWITGHAYTVGNCVTASGSRYICNTAHTSGATFTGDSAYWVSVGGGGSSGVIVNAVVQTVAAKPTGTGYYIFLVTPSDGLPSGAALGDICAVNSNIWSVYQTYASAPVSVSVGTDLATQQTWTKVYGTWAYSDRTSLDYLNGLVTPGTANSSAVGAILPFTKIDGTLSLSSSQVTLRAGRTYDLKAQVGLSTVSGAWCGFYWKNMTNGAQIPGSSTGLGSVIQNNLGNTYSQALASITVGSSDIQVAVVCNTTSNSSTFDSSTRIEIRERASSACVTSLPSSAIANAQKTTRLADNVSLGSTSGSVTVYTTTFTNTYDSLEIKGFCHSFASSGGMGGYYLKIDGTTVATSAQLFNSTNWYYNIPISCVISGISAGTHTLTVVAIGPAQRTDSNGRVTLTMTETYPVNTKMITNANITEWTEFTPSITATTTNPTPGNTSTFKCHYKVIGKSLYLRFLFINSGTGSNTGVGNYKVNISSLPFTIDTSQLIADGTGYASSQVGTGWITNGTTANNAPLKVDVRSGTELGLWVVGVWNTGGNAGYWSDTLHAIVSKVSFVAEVPIL